MKISAIYLWHMAKLFSFKYGVAIATIICYFNWCGNTIFKMKHFCHIDRIKQLRPLSFHRATIRCDWISDLLQWNSAQCFISISIAFIDNSIAMKFWSTMKFRLQRKYPWFHCHFFISKIVPKRAAASRGVPKRVQTLHE